MEVAVDECVEPDVDSSGDVSGYGLGCDVVWSGACDALGFGS